MSGQSTPWSQPGALTPVAPSPLPFPDPSSAVISLPRTPNSTPISPEPMMLEKDFDLDQPVDVPSVSLLPNGVVPSIHSGFSTPPGTLQPVSPGMISSLPSSPSIVLPQASPSPRTSPGTPTVLSPLTPPRPATVLLPSSTSLTSPSPRSPQVTLPSQFPQVNPSPRPAQVTLPSQFPQVSSSPRPAQVTLPPQFPQVNPSPRSAQVTLPPQFPQVSPSPRSAQVTLPPQVNPSPRPGQFSPPQVNPSPRPIQVTLPPQASPSQVASPQISPIPDSSQVRFPEMPLPTAVPPPQVQPAPMVPPTIFPVPSVPVPQGRRRVTNRSINRISRLGSIKPVASTLLADNETGDLRWNRPDRPEPDNASSSYRRIGCIGDGSCFFHAVAKGLSEVYQMSYREPTTISEETLRRLESSINYAIRFPSELFDKPRSDNPETVYQIRRPPYYRTDMGPVFVNLLYQFRIAYARHLRQDFANNIMTNPRMDRIIRNRFSGSIEMEQQAIEANLEQRLLLGVTLPPNLDVHEQAVRVVKDRLVQELLSGNPVQPDFMLILSDFVGVDIYLLNDGYLSNPDPRTNPLYSGSSLHESVHGPADMRPPGDRYQGTPDRRAIVIISVNDIHYEIVGRVDETQGPAGVSLHVHPNLSQTEPLVRQLYAMLRDTRAPSVLSVRS
jgi:hypothetical protein